MTRDHPTDGSQRTRVCGYDQGVGIEITSLIYEKRNRHRRGSRTKINDLGVDAVIPIGAGNNGIDRGGINREGIWLIVATVAVTLNGKCGAGINCDCTRERTCVVESERTIINRGRSRIGGTRRHGHSARTALDQGHRTGKNSRDRTR